jgi:negative regulator of flagellin synthesis FlgM
VRIHPIQQNLDVYKSQSTPQVKKIETKKKKDALEVSSAAKEYQVAYKALKDVPDVRADKIAALKEKVQSGTYSVDAMEVSEKMISQLDLRG